MAPHAPKSSDAASRHTPAAASPSTNSAAASRFCGIAPAGVGVAPGPRCAASTSAGSSGGRALGV